MAAYRGYSRPSGRASLKHLRAAGHAVRVGVLLPAFGPGLIEAVREALAPWGRQGLLPAFGPGLIEARRAPWQDRSSSRRYSRPSGRASLKRAGRRGAGAAA